MIVRALIAIVAVGAAGTAMAVGDLPAKLTQRQAGAEYASVRALLANAGRICPAGQVVVSGLVTGGATPTTGSRTVTVAFDKGAVVTIVRSWTGEPGKTPAMSVTVNCDPAPARRDVDVSRLTGDATTLPANCATIGQSLRVPQSVKCLRPSSEPKEVPGPVQERGSPPAAEVKGSAVEKW